MNIAAIDAIIESGLRGGIAVFTKACPKTAFGPSRRWWDQGVVDIFELVGPGAPLKLATLRFQAGLIGSGLRITKSKTAGWQLDDTGNRLE